MNGEGDGDLRAISTTLEQMPDGYLFVDRDGQYAIRYVNTQGGRLLGRHRTALLGQSIWDVPPFAQGACGDLHAACETAIASGEPVEREVWCEEAGIWMEVRAFPTSARNGLAIFFRDISERKEAERRLKESEARLRVAVGAAPLTLFAQDAADLRYTWIENPKHSLPDSVVGRTDYDLFPKAEAESLAAVKRDVLRTGVGTHLETALTIAGTVCHYELSMEPLRDSNGAVVGIVGAANDITERRRVEEALRQSEERFRALTERGSDLTLVLDSRGIIRYASPNTAAILGHSPTEVLGQAILPVIHRDDRRAAAAELRRLRRGRRRAADSQARPNPILCRVRYAPHDPAADADSVGGGGWRYFECIARSELANPVVAGIVVNARDVTERMLLEQQIIQTGKLAALGELVAGVAHEINNPLAVIGGHAQLLQMHPDPDVRADATAMRGMVDRATRIVRALKSISRPSSVSVRERTRADLNGLVRRALDLVGASLRRAEIDLDLRLSDDLPPVLVDAGEIEQVIVHLVNNAEHALRGGGIGGGSAAAVRPRLSLRTSVRSGSAKMDPLAAVTLTVEDNGPGIAPDVMGRIWEPFFTTKEQGEGIGLGLYICYGIVTAHGGTIRAENGSDDGAVFTVELPAAAE